MAYSFTSCKILLSTAVRCKRNTVETIEVTLNVVQQRSADGLYSFFKTLVLTELKVKLELSLSVP